MPGPTSRALLTSLTALAFLVGTTIAVGGVREYLLPQAAGAITAAAREPQPAARSAVEDLTKWKLIFADDFTGPAGSVPNPKNWIMTSGKNYGIATDMASGRNVHLSGNDALEIEAIRHGGLWTSGEVQTTQAFEPGLGQALMVIAHIKMPSGGQGYWPAFWAVGLPFRTNPNSEPTAGEIDIAETINDDKWLAQVLHCGPRRGGPCKENERKANGIGHVHMLSRPSGSIGWNTYGWEWVNRRVNPYIELTMNGVAQLEVSRDMIGAVAWHAAFDHPWYLVVDLAIGGGWPGPPSPSSASEGSISIARLRVYRS